MVFFILFSNRKRTPQKKHPAYILMDVLCTVSYSFGYHCLHLIYIYVYILNLEVGTSCFCSEASLYFIPDTHIERPNLNFTSVF